LPVNSPAWLEREKWNKEVAFNNKLPRRLRRKMPDLAFS
jgi:hypothetical protein